MDKLRSLASELQGMRGIVVSTRGQGKAVFLYVRSTRRAVEVSVDEGDICVEYWNVADEESDESPIREETFDDNESATKSIQDWLKDEARQTPFPGKTG
jgi:hypothetical protein